MTTASSGPAKERALSLLVPNSEALILSCCHKTPQEIQHSFGIKEHPVLSTLPTLHPAAPTP